MADLGFGASITFSSSYFSQITSIAFDGFDRPFVKTTHAGTTTSADTFLPMDTYDPGTVTIEQWFQPTKTPPINDATTTTTITWPLGSGESTAANWQFTSGMTSFSADAPFDDLMTESSSLQISGDITFSASS